MPVRLPPVTDHAVRVLFEGIVDYAGLFPPAALSMPVAVRNYAHYRASGAGWMLGRFVCSATALELFSEHAEPFLPRDAGAIPWRLTVTSSGHVDADLERIAAFNTRHRVCFDECGAVADAYEVKVSSAADIAALNRQIPRELMTYLEVPFADADELIPAVAASGRRAKMRTGGVTDTAFPSAEAVVQFLHQCLEYDVTAKATAGLHHPLCGAYRLTYDDNAPRGRMFGYMNVFLTAALLAQGADPLLAVQLMNEADAESIVITEERALWHAGDETVEFDRSLLWRTRERLLVSFGSCSFTEPVDEARAFGWL